jgi:adenosylmethionine-8-amino-7-oxononanoate aminotransferase
MLAAFDLDGELLVGEENAATAGAALMADLTADGVLIRPYGNTIVFGLALPTPAEEIDRLFDRFDAAITRRAEP